MGKAPELGLGLGVGSEHGLEGRLGNGQAFQQQPMMYGGGAAADTIQLLAEFPENVVEAEHG